MPELIDQLEWIIPLVGAIIILLLATYILNRYRKNRMEASIYWGLALVAQSLNFFMEFGLHSALLPRNAWSVFIAMLFSAAMLTLFYTGFAISLTENKFFTKILPILIFSAQVCVAAYVGLVLDMYILATVVQMGAFAFPLLIFFGTFFFYDYRSQGRKPSLILGVGWWIIASALPIYAVFIVTPYETIYHTIVLIAAILMFLGFVNLAHKPPTARQKPVI